MKLRNTALALLCATSALGLAADPIAVEVAPAFVGYSPQAGTAPVTVVMRNSGPDAQGVLRVNAPGFQTEYPVDLPQGSEKRLITYPTYDYVGATYTLTTNRGRVVRAYEPKSFGSGSIPVLLISDNPGELAFLRIASDIFKEQTASVNDCYVAPGEAPPRAVGYAGLKAVVLGSGAERLTDEEVKGIRSWLITGGTLVLLGGASSPALRDVRWADVVPITDLEPKNISNSRILRQLGTQPAPEATILSGTLTNGAIGRVENGTVVTAERGFGLGRVLYLGFNPLEPPLNTWSGRRTAFTRALRATDAVAVDQYLERQTSSISIQPYLPSTSPTSPVAYVEGGDPFSAKLPSSEHVLKILGLYFLAVIPLNFLILKKLKRGELAWFTAPVISVGFAGALFSSAESLYAAKLSTASGGVLVGQEGERDGMFVGYTEIFIPRSGVYDLQLHNVDSLGTLANDEYRGAVIGADQETMPAIDNGEVNVSGLRTRNLAFRRIKYRQVVPVGEWFKLDIKQKGEKWVCTVRNTGPAKVSQAQILLPNGIPLPVKDLQPGQSAEVAFKRADLNMTSPAVSDVPVMSRIPRLALSGSLSGFRPGPQLGNTVPERTRLDLLLFSDEVVTK